MKPIEFVKDKGMLLLLHLVCMCAASAFLSLTGYSAANIILLLTVWLMVLTGWLLAAYLRRGSFFREMEQILEKVDQRYLLGELIPDSYRLEDRLYKEMIRCSNKSCIEKIRQIEEAQQDYREYIESWVHEIKAPITGISLLCENRRGTPAVDAAASADDVSPRMRALGKEDLLTISLENQKIENYVDMALYYARSEQVYKDYLIRETDLEEVVYEVLEQNRLLLIQNHVRADVSCDRFVYTDRKWIAFILNQLTLNSVKYRSANPLLHIYTRQEENGVTLVFEDNGTGIRREELSRIFEKGFTGSNGRDHERSTGMGLYLCRRLCGQLGIRLHAESEYTVGTRLYLEFPISNYICREETD